MLTSLFKKCKKLLTSKKRDDSALFCEEGFTDRIHRNERGYTSPVISKEYHFRILDLPSELQYEIISQCTAISLLQLSHTSRYFYETVNGPTGLRIWKRFEDIHTKLAEKSPSLRLPVIKNLFFNCTMMSLFTSHVTTIAPFYLFTPGQIASIEVTLTTDSTAQRVGSFITIVAEVHQLRNYILVLLVSDEEFVSKEEAAQAGYVKLQPQMAGWRRGARGHAEFKVQDTQELNGALECDLRGKSVFLRPLDVYCRPKYIEATASTDVLLFETVVSNCNTSITNLPQLIELVSTYYDKIRG